MSEVARREAPIEIIASTTRSLIDYADHIQSCPVDDLGDAQEHVRMVRAWLKAKRAASDLKKAAARLEFVVVRRIGRDAPHMLDRELRPVGEWLAMLDDAAFDRLLDEVATGGTPKAAYNRMKQEGDLRRLSIADRDSLVQRELDRRDEEFVTETLDDLFTSLDGCPGFTIDDATAGFMQRLGTRTQSGEFDELSRRGFRHVVRQAVIAAEVTFTSPHGEMTIPRFPAEMHRHQGRVQWIRMPWRKATAADVAKLSDLRAEQAADLTARSEMLARFGALIDPEYPAATDCLGPMVDAALTRGDLTLVAVTTKRSSTYKAAESEAA